MGAAASSNLSSKEEFELFDKLKKSYEDCKGADEKEVFEVMRKTVADYTRSSEPKFQSRTGERRTSAYGIGTGMGNLDLDSKQLSYLNEQKLDESSTISTPKQKSDHSLHAAMELVPGDVVEAKEAGSKLYFEAIVVGRTPETVKTHYDLQFSDGEVESVAAENIRKINSWNCVEIGDKVKVKEVDSRMEYEATIVAMEMDGSYTVSYGNHSGDYSGTQGEDDDELEKGVTISRMRKIESHRSKAQERWIAARNVVFLAMTSFTAGAKK